MASSPPVLSAWQSRMRWLLAATVLVLGFVLAVPPSSWVADQVIDHDFQLLDDSYPLDLAAHLSHGQLAGRDFIFQYGPLTQLLHALGLAVPPGDAASLVRFVTLPQSLLGMLCVWGLLAATGAPLRWRAVLYLLWSCFWPPFLLLGLKPLPGLLLAVVGGRLAAGGTSRGETALALSTWALAAPLLLFVAFDMGVLTGVALLLTAAVVAITTLFRREPVAGAFRRRAGLLGGSTLAGAGLVFAGCQLVPGWGSFFADSWQVVSGYNTVLARGGPPEWFAAHVLTGAALTLLLCFTAWRLRASFTAPGPERARLLGLLAACCFGLVWLRAGLTRSDPHHQRIALGPALFVLGFLFPCCWRADRKPYYRLAPLLSLPVLLLSPLGLPQSVAQTTLQRLSLLTHLGLRRATLDIRHPAVRKAVAAADRLPGDALYVWPNETVVNVLSGKLNPDYTLQSTSAHTERLERATVERLAARPDLPALVFVDNLLIDRVEHLTRTPVIYRYLLDHYELTAPREPEFVLLRRSEGGTRRWVEQELPGVAGRFQPKEGSSQPLPFLEGEAGDCRASDLLLLRLRVARTMLWPVGKPGELGVEFTLSDGTIRVLKILVPPDGEEHEVLVSACRFRDPLFLSHFHPTRCWQARERVRSMRLLWAPLDLLSRQPAEVVLERAARWRRDGAVFLETSLAEQEQPQFWEACYQDGVGQLPAGPAR
jgi:hypothetical protein